MLEILIIFSGWGQLFETVLAARDAICFLLACHADPADPFVYSIVLKNGGNIGRVQAVSKVPIKKKQSDLQISVYQLLTDSGGKK